MNKLYPKIKTITHKTMQTLQSVSALKVAGYSAITLGVVAFMTDCADATSIDDKLTSFGTLLRGNTAKVGMTGATVIGTVAAAAKGSIGAAVAVFVIGVALSFYIGWIWGPAFAIAAV